MATMVKVKCANKSCGCEFMARLADRKRGWGKFCSKSCKAVKQERQTGQHARYINGGTQYRSRDHMSPSMSEGEVQ